MAYATLAQVQARMATTMTETQQTVCNSLLDDVAVLIDAYNSSADDDAKQVVSCMVVMRALGSATVGVPVGATQGSASAMGYSQSWTYTNGSTGELYLSRTEKKLLGVGNQVGSYSPLEESCTESA